MTFLRESCNIWHTVYTVIFIYWLLGLRFVQPLCLKPLEAAWSYCKPTVHYFLLEADGGTSTANTNRRGCSPLDLLVKGFFDFTANTSLACVRAPGICSRSQIYCTVSIYRTSTVPYLHGMSAAQAHDSLINLYRRREETTPTWYVLVPYR
jgi:hypothetical protein